MIGTSIKTDKTKRGREHIMRESGILMPVSSLPGPYGIGCFGAEALKFVDFLAAAGQHIWQLLHQREHAWHF